MAVAAVAGSPDTVLAEFQPRLGTRNMTGKLKAFASTVMGAQGAGSGAGVWWC